MCIQSFARTVVVAGTRSISTRGRGLISIGAACVVVAASVSALSAQTPEPPRNPSRVAFSCLDHAQDTEHEVGYFARGAAQPQMVQKVGDPPVDPISGEVTATVTVLPLVIGDYEMKVRALVGSVAGDWGAGGPAGDQPVPFGRAPFRPAGLRILPPGSGSGGGL